MAPTIITTVKVPPQPIFRGGSWFDLCSLEDVKLELDLEGNRTDKWLKRAISRASDTIARFCDRHFQLATFEDDYWAYRDPYPWQLPSGHMPLQLARWPLASPPSVAGTAPPASPPGLSQGSGGSLPATRYYAKQTYVTAEGETAAGLEANLFVDAGNLPTVASPENDRRNKAIGWNLYLGTESFCETLQNETPLAIGASFTLPTTGLTPGAALPPYALVLERAVKPWPLIEGFEFEADRKTAQLTRLLIDHQACKWSGVPIVAVYRAGYAEIEPALQDACIELVKSMWFGRPRDKMVKSENIEGIYQAEYWFGTGPGGPADMPAYVADKLTRYRVPVVA